MTSIVTYQGSLRTACVHTAGEQISTDAEIDNNGLEAYFWRTY